MKPIPAPLAIVVAFGFAMVGSLVGNNSKHAGRAFFAKRASGQRLLAMLLVVLMSLSISGQPVGADVPDDQLLQDPNDFLTPDLPGVHDIPPLTSFGWVVDDDPVGVAVAFLLGVALEHPYGLTIDEALQHTHKCAPGVSLQPEELRFGPQNGVGPVDLGSVPGSIQLPPSIPLGPPPSFWPGPWIPSVPVPVPNPIIVPLPPPVGPVQVYPVPVQPPLVPPLRVEDKDLDCLSDTAELGLGTNPEGVDTDGDLIEDGVEVQVLTGCNPSAWDTDGDTIPDYIEAYRGGQNSCSGPLNAGVDTDTDSYVDGAKNVNVPWNDDQEYRYWRPSTWDERLQGPWLFGTHPNNWDSDFDSQSDGFEIFQGDAPNESPWFLDWPQQNVRDPFTDAPPDFPIQANGDEDGDGLTWEQEWRIGTDRLNRDTDGDGLCDGTGIGCLTGTPLVGTEYAVRGLPTQADTDGDGLTDGLEAVMWATSTGAIPPGPNVVRIGNFDSDVDRLGGIRDPDNDNDGVNDGAEIALNTLPGVEDTDGDGLTDGYEVLGLASSPILADTDGDLLTDGVENLHYLSSVAVPDTDADGLNDGLEAAHGTMLLRPDTDVDSLTDGQELQIGTVPNLYDVHLDYDGDGVWNYREFQLGSNLLNVDTDGDLMPDGWEDASGLNLLVTDANGDADGDSLVNFDEFLAGTFAKLRDSDGDLLGDFDEVKVTATNPLDRDTDDDGMWDGPEKFYWDQLGPNMWSTNVVTSTAPPASPFLSNLHLPDSDLDGLLDRDEFMLSHRWPPWVTTFPSLSPANPHSADPLLLDGAWAVDIQFANMPSGVDIDGDGLVNWEETFTFGSNPIAEDTDCDGITDGLEVAYWDNPTGGPTWQPWLDSDVDEDGIKDATEINLFRLSPSYPYYSDPGSLDLDMDGLFDPHETKYQDMADLVPVGAAPPGLVPCSAKELQGNLGTAPTIGTPSPVGYASPPYMVNAFRDLPGWPAIWPPVRMYGTNAQGTATFIFEGNQHGPGHPMSPPFIATAFGLNPLASVGQSSTAAVAPLCPFPATPLIDGQNLWVDPTMTDSDGDGIKDSDELLIHCTLPWDCDSDADGVADGTEVGKRWHAIVAPEGQSIAHNPLCWRIDYDPLTATNPAAPLTDGDLLLDGPGVPELHQFGEDIGADGRIDPKVDGNPALADGDGDGLQDDAEFLALVASSVDAHAALLQVDSDGDGLQDPIDGAFAIGRFPAPLGSVGLPALGVPRWWDDHTVDPDEDPSFMDPDSDDDHVLDGAEVDRHSNVDSDTLASSQSGVATTETARENMLDTDSDNDGIPDVFDGMPAPGGFDAAPNLRGLGLLPKDDDFDNDGILDGNDLRPTTKEDAQALLNIAFNAGQILDYVDYEWVPAQVAFREVKTGEPYVERIEICKEEQAPAEECFVKWDNPNDAPAPVVHADAEGKFPDLGLDTNFLDNKYCSSRMTNVGGCFEDDLFKPQTAEPLLWNQNDVRNLNPSFWLRIQVWEDDVGEDEVAQDTDDFDDQMDIGDDHTGRFDDDGKDFSTKVDLWQLLSWSSFIMEGTGDGDPNGEMEDNLRLAGGILGFGNQVPLVVREVINVSCLSPNHQATIGQLCTGSP